MQWLVMCEYNLSSKLNNSFILQQ